ncbi:diacylglycerol O-acyltransferase [Babesia microti strain RI]|uniref:O-acyltransferase n=1 Tax=Babesia microti (strain RI) TaxID=1133968 RepID=A0A1R4AA18_BABMR|nr:diacylglycerol O-acyltransferase [Babesia microti strain RI]SJK85830.1 diacylglycerol O-acyltransferase [Babesia microti strain RI]|eukprot:XP_021338047.1 diacylglycerol O-acyltransferase [Babesia microti strain RI]
MMRRRTIRETSHFHVRTLNMLKNRILGEKNVFRISRNEETFENELYKTESIYSQSTSTMRSYSLPSQRHQEDHYHPIESQDYIYKSRPLHNRLHTEYRKSLLSTGTKHLNLKGFANLAFILLVVMNFRMVIVNLLKYGLIITVPATSKVIKEHVPLFKCALKMNISIVHAWMIERYLAPLSDNPLTLPIMLLQALNMIILLVYPFLTVLQYPSDPTISAFVLFTSVVWTLKTYSLHHVCYDCRRALAYGDDMNEVCVNIGESKAASMYPKCLTLYSVYEFMAMPTICFQFFYPRTLSINWFRLFRHAVELVFLLVVLKIIADQYIILTVKNTFTMEEFKSANFIHVAAHIIDRMIILSLPIFYCWLIMFVTFFHHWFNILAEITRFGDRKFYDDWWNASSFSEYWIKWNLPVHQFVKRHIGMPLTRRGFSSLGIQFFVFTLSAALHEYLISVPLGLGWTGYVFWFMMGQIPLLKLTKIERFKNNKTLGNVLFWCLFSVTGHPLGILLYWYLWGVKQGKVS